jgi:hypothetical protein
MEKNHECRRRPLQMHVPVVVPMHQRFRLLSTDVSHTSLADVFEHGCASRGVDHDQALLRYYEVVSKATNENENLLARAKVYGDICNDLVPDSLLSQFVFFSCFLCASFANSDPFAQVYVQNCSVSRSTVEFQANLRFAIGCFMLLYLLAQYW